MVNCQWPEEAKRGRRLAFEHCGPQGGRVGFAFGEPLRRWGLGISIEMWERDYREIRFSGRCDRHPIPARRPFDETRCFPILRP